MRRFIKRFRVPLVILLLLGGGLWYFFFVARVHRHVEKDGWVFDFSYIRMRCPTCSGIVHRLEYAGRGVPLPRFKNPADTYLMLSTPVGQFEARGKPACWRFMASERLVQDSAVDLSDRDRARGYYEVSAEELNAGNAWTHRKGTPAHWCVGVGRSVSRWFDPAAVEQLEW